MKLMAPIGSNGIQGAISQLEIGVDEIYFGSSTDVFNNFTFSGRTRCNQSNERIYLEDNEVEEVVKIIHSYGACAVYAANFPFLAEDNSGEQKFIKAYLQYVEKGLQAGVDSLIVGDIGALLLLKKQGYKVHITASTYFEIINTQQLLLLKELGIDRAVISFQSDIDDIERFCKANIMEIEVFAQGCSFYDANCYLHNGKTCAEKFCLKYDKEISTGAILDASQNCSLCSLKKLKDIGVNVVKLVGRENNYQSNTEVTKVYAAFLRELDNISDFEDEATWIKQTRDKIIPVWWKRINCKLNRCRYQKNCIVQAYT